jgi:hypothetical protein
MKPRVAGIGSFVAAFAAVVGSVALSLLILHPPPEALLPGTAPADRAPVAALILPAARVSKAPQQTRQAAPVLAPADAALLTPPAAPSVSAPRPAPSPRAPRSRPVPAPAVPSTAPVPPVPAAAPVAAAPRNNGRWSSEKPGSWKGAAVRQSERVEPGKPPWAAPGHDRPVPPAAPAAAPVPPAPPVQHGQGKGGPPHAGPRDKPPTPPGQGKTKSPHS